MASPLEQKKNTGNPNHPKKGSQIKVDPIKKVKDIKKLLAGKHPEILRCLSSASTRTYGHQTCYGSKSDK
jgi:hypothetical protein